MALHLQKLTYGITDNFIGGMRIQVQLVLIQLQVLTLQIIDQMHTKV